MKETLHNIMEDKVISRVDAIFKSIEDEGYTEKYCTCNQCRMDVVCYVLNRLHPHYISSHRGASRVQGEGSEMIQQGADITSLIHEGLKRVNHNRRPNFAHSSDKGEIVPSNQREPVFNIPTIMGRLFNGDNFAPIHEAVVELLWNGELVSMKDNNWQNPYRLVPHAEGIFSFWPAPAITTNVDARKIFEYTARVSAPGFEILNHFFKIPLVSEPQVNVSFTLDRTFKLPDLYLFPPGEAEKNGYLD